MAFEFRFPDVGEGIHEGKIVNWLVKEGDEVKADQALAEVETDKAIVEIPSPKAGKILKVTHAVGETIKVGDVLVTIEQGEDTGEGEVKATSEPKEEETTKAATANETKKTIKQPKEKRESTGVVGALEETAAGVLKAPSLESSGAVFGQGGGRRGGVAEAAEKPTGGIGVVKEGIKQVKKYDLFGYIDRLPYDGVRKAVGIQITKSVFTIPHVTHTDLADVTELFELREKEKKVAAKQNINLTFLPFFIKAVVNGLKKHPLLNAELNEEEGIIILKKYYNIGIAVDTKAGLMVPVIKGADKKSIMEMAKEITELAEKARAKKLNPMDMKGGTFTITNIGSAGGGWYATPVINYPECAILATGMIQDAPLARGGKVEIRKVLPLSLSFDHRVLDGAEAARFTILVKQQLESPGLMLMEDQ